MSRCLRCGQDNEKTARFCVGCGEQLSQNAASPSEEHHFRGEAVDATRGLPGSQHPSPQPGRLTPHGSRSAAPGLLPALIVPGSPDSHSGNSTLGVDLRLSVVGPRPVVGRRRDDGQR